MKADYNQCEEIASEYGDSFYLFKEKQFEQNYNDLQSAFTSVYPETSIGYSYKTNYLPYLGRLIDIYGGSAEVTSEMEYEIAIKNGISPDRIILNGPIHKKAFIEKALLMGLHWNVDGFRQLVFLKEVCSAYPDKSFKIGIRLNVSNPEEFTSRFGFDVGNGAASKAVALVEGIDNCELVGLHSHYWLPERKPESFVHRLKEMIAFAKMGGWIHKLEYLNVGGSFYGPLSTDLASQMEKATPTFQEYGNAIGSEMMDAFPEGGVKLYIEPGVSMVGNSIDYIARVYDIKQVHDRRFAIVEGSVHNVKPSLHRYKLKTEVISKSPRVKDVYDLVGYTCLEYDYLRKELSAGLEIGDFVRIHDIGAYTITIKAPFIKGAPPILTLKDGMTKLLRRDETFDDIFTTYNFDT